MKIPRTRISQTIASRTLKDGTSKEYARELAAFLLAEKRTGELDSILRDVQSDWADSGHVEAIAHTTHPLDQTAKSEIERVVRGIYPDATTIVVTELHDTAVLGGVELHIANRVLDLSVEAKLNKFKQLTGAGKE